jgi:hypothetical protein
MLNNITNRAIFRNIIALFSMLLVKNGYGAVSQILNDSFFQNPAELLVVNNTQAIIGNVFINPNIKFKGSSYGISGGSLQEGTEFPSAPLQPFARLGCSQ